MYLYNNDIIDKIFDRIHKKMNTLFTIIKAQNYQIK